jgi:hypothetical protein
MVALCAALSMGVFAAAFVAFGILAAGTGALTTVQSAVAAMRDPQLADDEREKRVQTASVALIRAFVSIAMRSALAVALAFCPLWLFERFGLASIQDVLVYLARRDVIAFSSVLITIGFMIWHRATS